MLDNDDQIRIPGFEIIKELGRGGQSLVFEAIEETSDKRVAIKLLSHLSDAHLFRLEREYEILKGLDVDGVVKVHDFGKLGARFYLVLELVQGRSLRAILGETRLQQHEATEIVITVARSLQRVHDAKVIHRDLKPSNVLRSTDGKIKLVDFGLARKLDETSDTTTGRIMGTHAYMSPEQALGDSTIDERSDVFSLGVMLYEMLVGDTPFADLSETRSSKPPKWSSRARATVARDLKAICLKALEKNRRDRFQSARELTEELERFSRQQPISTRYGWRSETRRLCLLHPLAATAAVLTTLLLVSVVIGSMAYATQYLRTAAALERSNANLAEAVKAFDFVGREVGIVDLERVPRMEKLRRKILERTLQFNERLLAGNPEEELSLRETGLAHIRVGDMRRALGEDQEAEASYLNALETLRRAKDQAGGLEYEIQKGLTTAQYSLADLLIDSGRFDEVAARIARLRESLAALHEHDKDGSDYLELSGNLLMLEGRKLVHEKRQGDAAPLYVKAIRIKLTLAETFPDNDSYTVDLAKGHGAAAVCLAQTADYSGAEQHYLESIRLFEKAGDETNLGTSWRNLAIVYRKTGKLDQAIKAYESGKQILELQVLIYPESVRFRSELAGALHGLAFCFLEEGSPQLGLPHMQRSVDLQKAVVKLVSTNVSHQQQLRSQILMLCDLYLNSGDHQPAAENIDSALELPTEPMHHVIAAVFWGRCAELAMTDDSVTDRDRQTLTSRYVDRAVQILASAKDNGLIQTSFLESDGRLGPLRKYDAFNKLLDDTPMDENSHE